MKKLLFVLLAAALALPMMAQTKADEAAAMANFRHGTNPSYTLQKKQATIAATREDIPEGYCSVTLQAEDVWGDGTGYQLLLDADATAYGTIIPTSGAMSTSDVDASVYAEFEYKIPENADGALSTANIVCDDAVTIFIPAGVYDWCITNPTPGDAMWIASSNGSIPGRYDDYEFAAGAIYVFHVSYGGYNDQVDLEIVDLNAPEKPENVTVTVDGVDATVAWTNDHDPAFNLRYRVYDPDAAQSFFWNFDTDESIADWKIYDADGDGYNWRLNNTGVDGSYCITSDSYYSGARTPDNWAFSPEVPLGGTLTFMTNNYSSSYPDKIMVYACIGDYETEEGPDLEKFVAISDFIQPGTAWEEHTIVIPDEFRGQMGHFAFRHYDCENEWRINVDDVAYVSNGNEPGEWIVVPGIEGNEYLLEGLDPETTYEVQVQAVSVDGRTSDWTESVLFTTEEAGTTPTEKTGAPTFNGYTTDGIHAYFVEIVPSEPSTIYYRIKYGQDGEFTEWAVYEDILSFTQDGWYRIEAYAIADGKLQSDPIAYEFVVSPVTGLSELINGKTVANVLYYNMAGQEMQEANGMTIVVTTYTDGTTNAVKVMK